MTALWSSQEIDKIVQGQSTSPWKCKGISIDTRTLNKGDLFVALKSEAGDGHAYLEEAAKKGAAAALVSEECKALLPIILVKDTLVALQQIGVAAQQRSPALRIAVTGSVGKTSTKDMLLCALKDQTQVHGSVSSYNNHWGVPLTLARMPKETGCGIFEVGMNHSGEITPLTKMIQPDIAIITSVVESHIEFFNSLEDIAFAKAEIFEGLKEGGAVILNKDNSFFDLLKKLAQERKLTVYSFGKHEDADFRLQTLEIINGKNVIAANFAGKVTKYEIPIPGEHWVMNSLAVLGAAYLAKMDVKKASESLASITPPSGRGQHFKGIFTVIDESYNANPTSMEAAIRVLGDFKKNRKVAVIGDMRELGRFSRIRHEGLLDALMENEIDLVFCCGPYMAYLFESLPDKMQGGYALSSKDLISQVCAEIEDGDVVTVKASLGTRVKPIVEALLELQKERTKKVS